MAYASQLNNLHGAHAATVCVLLRAVRKTFCISALCKITLSAAIEKLRATQDPTKATSCECRSTTPFREALHWKPFTTFCAETFGVPVEPLVYLPHYIRAVCCDAGAQGIGVTQTSDH